MFYICPIRGKYVGIENLINKGKEAWFSVQKIRSKIKRITIDTYLSLKSL